MLKKRVHFATKSVHSSSITSLHVRKECTLAIGSCTWYIFTAVNGNMDTENSLTCTSCLPTIIILHSLKVVYRIDNMYTLCGNLATQLPAHQNS
jgi:hypothetical protein